MAERELCAEFPPLFLISNRISGVWELFDSPNWKSVDPTVSENVWVCQNDIDLAGYNQQDLTLFFRNSFEQIGGNYTGSWNIEAGGKALNEYSTMISEFTVVSSVPLSNDDLYGLPLGLPGFIQFQRLLLDFGVFDRSHIIHGRKITYGLSPNIGTAAFTDDGDGLFLVADDQYFSSLEPTAADRLYSYRVIGIGNPGVIGQSTGLVTASVPAKRILLSAASTKEEDLDYMMRLKRSYELANQE